MYTISIDTATRELMHGKQRLMRRLLWPLTTGTRRKRKLSVGIQLRLLKIRLYGVEPSQEELYLLTTLGRVGRLIEGGLSPMQAVAKMAQPETREEYTRRNSEAMEALEARLLSPEYMARFAEISAIADPVNRAEASAALKRENFRVIDMVAVHRQIGARNRQWKREGVLPPDAPI